MKTIFEAFVETLKNELNKFSTGVDMSNFELEKVGQIEREANWINTGLCGNFLGSDNVLMSDDARAKGWISDILFYNGYYDVIRVLKVDKPKRSKRDSSWMVGIDKMGGSDFLRKTFFD